MPARGSPSPAAIHLSVVVRGGVPWQNEYYSEQGLRGTHPAWSPTTNFLLPAAEPRRPSESLSLIASAATDPVAALVGANGDNRSRLIIRSGCVVLGICGCRSPPDRRSLRIIHRLSVFRPWTPVPAVWDRGDHRHRSAICHRDTPIRSRFARRRSAHTVSMNMMTYGLSRRCGEVLPIHRRSG